MLRHSYDDSLPFCGDDCSACRIAELVRWAVGPFTAAERRGDPVDEPYYVEIPADPSDRAAYYARQPEPVVADVRYARTAALSRAFRSTFRHDHPAMNYDA